MGAGVTLRNNHNNTGEDATAYPHGGGVHVNGGRFEMTGGTISSNAASIGGGVFVTNNGRFTMSGNSTISGNAAKSGGGVLAYNGAFTMTGGTISDNTATLDDGDGGGVYVADDATFSMSGGAVVKPDVYLEGGSSSPAKITVVGSLNPPSGEYSAKITLGNTDDNPVVLAGEGYSLVAEDIKKFKPLNSGSFLVYNNNQGILARPGAGEAFYVSSGGTLQSASTLGEAITMVPNGTETDPAPVYVAKDVTLSSDINISSKHIKLTVGDGEPKAITRGSSNTTNLFTVNTGASLTLDGRNGTLTLDGGWNNKTESGTTASAPLVTVSGGTLTMDDEVTLQNNYKPNGTNGGAVRVTDNGKFIMKGGMICNNTTTSNGGGVYVKGDNSTFEMSGGTISGNEAYGGGGVYQNGGTFTISGGTIYGSDADDASLSNTVTNSGAAYYRESGTAQYIDADGNSVATIPTSIEYDIIR
jgi:hypothetical protein